MPKKLDHTAACEHLSRVDRRLARIMLKSGECRLQQETTQNIFEALLESIIYQQLNGKVAATITERVKALFPENQKRLRTRRGLVNGFPTPEQILEASEERLRSAGLSRAKMLAIRDLAAKTVDGTVPTLRQANRMSDEELVERIDTVRGIGRWTVEMLLIFRLGRPDVLPVDDYGVRKGFAKIHKLEELPETEGANGVRRAMATLSKRRELVPVAGGRNESPAHGGKANPTSQEEPVGRPKAIFGVQGSGRQSKRPIESLPKAEAPLGFSSPTRENYAAASHPHYVSLALALRLLQESQELVAGLRSRTRKLGWNKRWHLGRASPYRGANIRGMCQFCL